MTERLDALNMMVDKVLGYTPPREKEKEIDREIKEEADCGGGIDKEEI